MVQQRGESGLPVSAGGFVDSHERRWGATPALRPVLPVLTESLLGPAPSLRALRCLQWLHWYYEQVRLPTSARLAASVFPRDDSPSATMPTAPVGSPGSRRRPVVRDAIHDPGGVSPSRITTADMWPSTTGTVSASTTFRLSGLSFRTPQVKDDLVEPTAEVHTQLLGDGYFDDYREHVSDHLPITVRVRVVSDDD